MAWKLKVPSMMLLMDVSGFLRLDAVMGYFGDDVAPELECPKMGFWNLETRETTMNRRTDAEADGQADAQAAHEGLLLGSDSLGLQRNIEEVVEAEDSLKQDQQKEGDDVFHDEDARKMFGAGKKGI